MAQHQVIVHNANGDRLGVLDTITEFDYTKVANGVGAWSLTAPINEWPLEWRGLDFQYHFWRKPSGGEWRVDFVGLQQDSRTTTQRGITVTTLTGVDQNDILRRRIVAAKAGSSGAQKTDYIDDMMKAIVTEQLGSGAADGRDISTVFRLSVAADQSLAPSISKGFAYENVLDTLQDLANTSAGQASGAVDLFFDVALTGYNGNNQPLFEFRTYTGQPGVDRTYPDGQYPVFFSIPSANIDNVDHQRIYSDEVNYVYAVGLGFKNDRNVQEAGDTPRINYSPINRKEAFVSASHLEDADVLEAVYEELNASRPQRVFNATLIDTENTPYQVRWNHGDKISIAYGRYQDYIFNEVIRVTNVRVDQNKKETITGQFGYGALLTPELQLMRNLKKMQKQLKKMASGAEFAKYMGYGSSVPTATDLPRKGMYFNYENGLTRRVYFNHDGTNIRFITVT